MPSPDVSAIRRTPAGSAAWRAPSRGRPLGHPRTPPGSPGRAPSGRLPGGARSPRGAPSRGRPAGPPWTPPGGPGRGTNEDALPRGTKWTLAPPGGTIKGSAYGPSLDAPGPPGRAPMRKPPRRARRGAPGPRGAPMRKPPRAHGRGTKWTPSREAPSGRSLPGGHHHGVPQPGSLDASGGPPGRHLEVTPPGAVGAPPPSGASGGHHQRTAPEAAPDASGGPREGHQCGRPPARHLRDARLRPLRPGPRANSKPVRPIAGKSTRRTRSPPGPIPASQAPTAQASCPGTGTGTFSPRATPSGWAEGGSSASHRPRPGPGPPGNSRRRPPPRLMWRQV